MLADCVAALEPLLESGEGEVIVVDDRSSNENQTLNREACSRFSGVRYHLQTEGRGAPAARNCGTRLATGRFIWYLDDDDRPGPQTIRDVLSAARTDDGETVIALPMRIMLDGECFRLIQPTQEGMSFDFVRRNGHQVNTSCAVFSRSLLERVGPWDESLLTGQDTDLFLRVAEADARCLTPQTEPVRVEWSHPARITRAVWRQPGGTVAVSEEALGSTGADPSGTLPGLSGRVRTGVHLYPLPAGKRISDHSSAVPPTRWPPCRSDSG